MGKSIIISDFTTITNLGTVTIVNEENISLTSINITTKPTSVMNSAQLYVTYVPSNATNKTVIWSSSNTEIATVSSSGLVTVLSLGTVTITVTSQENSLLSDSCTFTCSLSDIPVTAIAVTGNTSGEVGGTILLSASLTPSNTTQTGIIWSSSNTSVATVNGTGFVTLLSVGSVTITATSSINSSVFGTIDINISSPTVATKAIISMTRPANGINYATLPSGDYINVTFPNGTAGGANFTIKGIDGSTFCTQVHNTTTYPSMGYTWVNWSYRDLSWTGNTGTYTDVYFAKSCFLGLAVSPKRGLFMFSNLVNGNYKIKLYPSETNSAFSYNSTYQAIMKFEANDSGAVAFTFNPYQNNTQFIELTCQVTDGTLIIMGYCTQTLNNAPMLSIIEMEKI